MTDKGGEIAEEQKGDIPSKQDAELADKFI